MLHKTIIAAVAVVFAAAGGCQTQAQVKKAAQMRWQKTSAQIKLTLAQQQYDDRDYQQAARTVEECLTADPNSPAARLLYGKLLLGNGRRAEAVEQLSFALELDENLHECWYWLGVAEQENRRYRNACENYSKALSFQPANVDYILAVADTHVARNHSAAAIKLLTEKIAGLPNDVSLKVALADLMVRVSRYDDAAELYRQAMLLTSDNRQIAEALAYCYMLGKKWDAAAEVFDELIAFCPDPQQNKMYLQASALCAMNGGQYKKAVACYSRLSADERDNHAVWLKLGQAALGAGRAYRALECANKALALKPGYADAIALAGCAQYTAADYSLALRTFRQITRDKKNAAFALLMTARCYEQLGQPYKAKLAREKALEINPNSQLADLLAKETDMRKLQSLTDR